MRPRFALRSARMLDRSRYRTDPLSRLERWNVFYEAYTSECSYTFRELILTDSDATSRAIRLFRPFSWALFAVRLESTPSTPEQVESVPRANALLQACLSLGAGVHRYDRVVILQRGAADEIAPLVDFLRERRSQMFVERRVFLAQIGDAINPEEIERAIGGASCID